VLYGLQVAAVVLSVDYRHLRVHYTHIGETASHSLGRALDRVTPFLRARLADAVDLKRVPELHFVRDV